MFEKIRSEFQCLKGESPNSNFWKDKKRKDKVRIPMFERREPKIPISGRIRNELQCLKG